MQVHATPTPQSCRGVGGEVAGLLSALTPDHRSTATCMYRACTCNGTCIPVISHPIYASGDCLPVLALVEAQPIVDLYLLLYTRSFQDRANADDRVSAWRQA